MRILVTGGAGFIASHIAERFVHDGHQVTVLDNLSHGKIRHIPPRVHFLQAELASPEVEDLFKTLKPEIVCHHAAQIDVVTSMKQPLADAGTNILGTLALLLHCRNYGVQKFIYASSAAVYGTPMYLPIDEKHPVKPLSCYGISKHTPEHYIEAFSNLYGLDYTILRYANVYGPRQDPTGEGGVISIFLNKIERGEAPVIYGDGQQTRDFIYVKDIVSANAAALTRGSRQILNVSCNQATSVLELLQLLAVLTGKTIVPAYKPALPGDILHSVLNNRAAISALNWSPEYSVPEGLKDTLTSQSG
ncbi:NAD-dependent epimerase/dehydratase family protein [Paenibacillus harenae]|uniref:NAD-dependent epimerase/dehydratase family protein n=1 Tax=Paenibacillus harenae TaxID=306543 RepID=UPI0004023B97|nr:NAD-dependent epimerase/dehydratase family protein [Paenibacillus harenae]